MCAVAAWQNNNQNPSLHVLLARSVEWAFLVKHFTLSCIVPAIFGLSVPLFCSSLKPMFYEQQLYDAFAMRKIRSSLSSLGNKLTLNLNRIG